MLDNSGKGIMDDLLVTPGFFNREDKLSRAAASRSLNGLHKVLYDAVGQLSSDLSEEAISTLCDDAKALELNSLTLRFRNQGQLMLKSPELDLLN